MWKKKQEMQEALQSEATLQLDGGRRAEAENFS